MLPQTCCIHLPARNARLRVVGIARKELFRMTRLFGVRGRVGLRHVLALIALLGAATAPMYAQSDRGTIQGRVTDQSGGVVPDAKVEAIHLETATTTAAST